MIALFLSLAFAKPSCEASFTPIVGETISVAWITPVRERVLRGGAWLEVVPTAELQRWLGEHPQAGVGRTLQFLGHQRKEEDPAGLYKVTVFEAAADSLCRPMKSATALAVGGSPVCAGARRRTGCGYAVDRASGERALDVFRVRWRDAAARGFCVLPLDRFVVEGRR